MYEAVPSALPGAVGSLNKTLNPIQLHVGTLPRLHIPGEVITAQAYSALDSSDLP